MMSSTILGAWSHTVPVPGVGCDVPSSSSLVSSSPAMTLNNPAPCLCVESDGAHEKWQVQQRKFREHFRQQFHRLRAKSKSQNKVVLSQQPSKTENGATGGLIYHNTNLKNIDGELPRNQCLRANKTRRESPIDLIDWSSGSSDDTSCSSSSSSTDDDSDTFTSQSFAEELFSSLDVKEKSLSGSDENQLINKIIVRDLMKIDDFSTPTVIRNRISPEAPESQIRFKEDNGQKYEFLYPPKP